MIDAREAQLAMSGYVNNMSFNPQEFVELMARDHRTLQQSFTGLCLQWLKHLSQLKDSEIDGRNEYSVKIAKELLSKVEDWQLNVPLI